LENSRGPLIIAHRTCPPYAPENSLQGIRVAAEQGADVVEIDVRVSLDQRPFLMHDNSMRRTSGWPLPMELTPAFLVRKQRLHGASESVPSLEGALDAVAANMMVAMDLKTPWAVFPLLNEIRRRGIDRRALIWCSSGRVARYIAGRSPQTEVALYKDLEEQAANRRLIDKAASLGLRAVSLDWRSITPPLVEYSHSRGLRVYSWHREADLSDEKLACRLDGIITDHPARVLSVLSRRSAHAVDSDRYGQYS
jgi:glycerophosphoryl diester phosphodiesterase